MYLTLLSGCRALSTDLSLCVSLSFYMYLTLLGGAELFLHLISHSKRRSQIDQIFDAMSQAEGAFSCVVLTDDCLVAVRDPNGLPTWTHTDAVTKAYICMYIHRYSSKPIRRLLGSGPRSQRSAYMDLYRCSSKPISACTFTDTVVNL